jgi:glycerol uptake facilitator-like aquaporin
VATGIYDDLWLYFAGPAVGGLAAGLLYRGVFAEE